MRTFSVLSTVCQWIKQTRGKLPRAELEPWQWFVGVTSTCVTSARFKGLLLEFGPLFPPDF